MHAVDVQRHLQSVCLSSPGELGLGEGLVWLRRTHALFDIWLHCLWSLERFEARIGQTSGRFTFNLNSTTRGGELLF